MYRPRHLSRAYRRLIDAGRTDYVLHCLNLAASRMTYAIRGVKKPLALDNIAASLNERGFYLFPDCEIRNQARTAFAPSLFYLREIIREYGESYRPVAFLNNRGYVGRQFDVSNQTHAPDLPDNALVGIREFMETSGIGTMFRSLYRANYGVCNARVWRYRPKTGKPLDVDVGAHIDGLPPYAWKLMYFDGHVGEDGGSLQLLGGDGQVIARVSGDCPMVIFDSNNIYHRTDAPAGTPRDSLELTICPQIWNGPRVVAAGYQAGYPANPFRRWDRYSSASIITCTE